MRTTVLILTALTLALAGLVIDYGIGAPRQGQAAGTGDTNCDGTTNSIDALFILQVDARLLGGLQCQENADMNADGTVNSIDASIILQYVAGLLGGPPPAATPTPPAESMCQVLAEGLEALLPYLNPIFLIGDGPISPEDVVQLVLEFRSACSQWIQATGWNLVHPECHPVPAPGCKG